jgi:mRNA interferase MazF
MEKNFDVWNDQKKSLENFSHQELSFHERDIWWCSLGLNLGDEQDGKNENFERPVLVVKKFNHRIALILPMTTKAKNNRFVFAIQGPFLSRNSFLIFSQIRLISVKRFRRRIGRTSSSQFKKIRARLIQVLFS